VIYYVSRTGTRRNLQAIRAAGFRLLVSSAGRVRTEGFPYGLDNGKWTAHTTGQPWDEPAFISMVGELGAGADWLVVPDIVEGGLASLELSREWLPRLEGLCPLLLIAVQDGMAPEDLEGLVGPDVGIFLGGSTAWKLQTMKAWGAFAHRVGCHFHVGRVNTAKRMALAISAGAHTADGSSASRFAETVPMLLNATRQVDLFAPGRC
jgi:hypothetical protein